MKSFQKLDQIDLKSKKVVLRVDFNVPIIKNKILDDFKMQSSYKTIKFLLENNCQIVLISHLGRPMGKVVPSLSLKPVYAKFKKDFSNKKIVFVSDKLTKKTFTKIKNKKADVIFLENIRFDKREDSCDLNFAKQLASLGELFVNEAFAGCHRKQASIYGISKFLPSYAGFNLAKEVLALQKVLKPRKPAVALIGGAKIETKIAVIKNFFKIYNYILIGGALANTFLAAKGYQVGGSLFEKKQIRQAKILLKNKKLILPIDVLVETADKKVRLVLVAKNKIICQKQEKILDIGPATIKKYSDLIRKAQTIVWNGPMGFVENPKFAHGTLAIAKIIASRASGKAFAVAGGGETVLTIQKTKMMNYFDFVSSGGGSMLYFLEGRDLPGLKLLK